jgi:hypothetical protein
MKRFLLLVGAPLGAFLTGCGGMTVFPGAAAVPPSLTMQTLQDATAHHVYWTLFAGSASPQVQIAAVPLRETSKATSIFNNSHNGLLDSSGMHVDKSGRLWILAFGPSNGDPGIVSVFTLPLKSTSSPKYTFVYFALSPTGDLYFANCGSSPGVDVYPTSKKAFSSKLAPSVLYTNSYITGAGCAWGIAIK